LLASQFNSFIQPLLIMLALPLAIIGALLALLITGFPLDLTAFIGFIMLMGLVTKNSILLVDFANRERANGIEANEAMRRAGPVRLRPILMTSLALILAMIPVALGLSAGGEFRQAMAIAIMGGMITSTLLTLVVVPVAYGMVVGFMDRVSARRKARRETKETQRRAERRAAAPTLDPLDAPLAVAQVHDRAVTTNGKVQPSHDVIVAETAAVAVNHQPVPAELVGSKPASVPSKNGDGAPPPNPAKAPKEYQLQPEAKPQTPPELTLRQRDSGKSVYELKSD